MRADIATMLLDRHGDEHLGLRTRDRDWTWDAVVRESAARGALAHSMRRAGPFHVGVLLENVPDFVFWLRGAALAGATIVGINPTRGDAGMAAEIPRADCQMVVTDTVGAERLRRLDLGLPPDRFLNIDDPDYARLLDTHRVDPTISAGVEQDSLFLLLFTSGTTGASKAVKCSQGRLARIAYAATEKFGHHRQGVEYCCMPLFHGNAIMALWAPALANGATVCLTPAFSASRFLPDARYFGATFFTYVGKALAYLMATPEQVDDIENPLVRGFGTEASPDDQSQFRRRFGAELFEGYGSSDGGHRGRRSRGVRQRRLGRIPVSAGRSGPQGISEIPAGLGEPAGHRLEQGAQARAATAALAHRRAGVPVERAGYRARVPPDDAGRKAVTRRGIRPTRAAALHVGA
jgi:fatty-acyl-CoA synthase